MRRAKSKLKVHRRPMDEQERTNERSNDQTSKQSKTQQQHDQSKQNKTKGPSEEPLGVLFLRLLLLLPAQRSQQAELADCPALHFRESTHDTSGIETRKYLSGGPIESPSARHPETMRTDDVNMTKFPAGAILWSHLEAVSEATTFLERIPFRYRTSRSCN